jgi:hypothetical protein
MLDINVGTAPVDDEAMSKRKLCDALMHMVIAAHAIMQLDRYNDGLSMRCKIMLL